MVENVCPNMEWKDKTKEELHRMSDWNLQTAENRYLNGQGDLWATDSKKTKS